MKLYIWVYFEGFDLSLGQGTASKEYLHYKELRTHLALTPLRTKNNKYKLTSSAKKAKLGYSLRVLTASVVADLK